MSIEQTAIDCIKTHKFRPHQGGDYGLFGLNMFGSDSTINYTEIDGSVDIWRFIYYTVGSNDAVYINACAVKRKFDLNDKNIFQRAVRLEVKVD